MSKSSIHSLVFSPQRSWVKETDRFRPILSCVGALFLGANLVACGPELKTESKVPQSSKEKDKINGKSGEASGKSKSILDSIETTLSLRAFDAGEWVAVTNDDTSETPAAGSAFTSAMTDGASFGETRNCETQGDLGTTTVYRQWAGKLGNTVFLPVGSRIQNGTPSARIETWSRPESTIPCSSENWAKIGWQSGLNLKGLKQKVFVQLNLSRESGARKTETYTKGERVFSYDPDNFKNLSDTSLSFQRTLIIGSENLPNEVRVVLKEGETEIRRTTGFVHTDPAAPIIETVTRSKGESPSVLGRTIESGRLFTTQPDGTKLTTTISSLVYKGRRADGSFSCVPVSGSISDDIQLSTGENLLVKREILDGSLTLSTTCRKGVSVEVCSDLIQKTLRKSLTPYCLY